MRLRASVLFAAMVLLGAGTGAGAAVQEGAANVRVEAIEASTHPEVRVTVSVPLEVAGEGLPDTAFGLLEDGAPRDVRVTEVSTADLQVLLLIDTTGSMDGEPIAVARAAATAFVRRLPGDVQIAVLDYDVETRVVTPFSTDTDAHVAGVQGLQPGGDTATYDAIAVALDTFPAAGGARQVIVLLTDGQDNASTTPLAEATQRLADAGVTLYAIEFMTDFTDSQAIADLASASGGETKPADDPESLARVYNEIAAQLTNQYALSYRSEGSGRTELTVLLDHGGGVGRATQVVDLPAPSPVPSQSSVLLLLIGLGAVYLAIVLLVLGLLAPGGQRARLQASIASAQARIRGISGMSDWVTGATDRLLDQRGWASRINGALEQAGVNLRASEFCVLAGSVAVAAGAVGHVLSGLPVGLLLCAATAALARVALSVLGDRRRAKFADQLGDTLQLLSGSLRAGYSIMQAVDAVAREADAPTSQEFRRLIVETRLGRAPNEALDAMAQRLGSEDFEWVVEAMEIQREIGGDLAEVLDTVAETIRERNRIRRQVKALSVEGRLSAVILFILPLGLGAFLMLSNPGYLSELFVTMPGRVMSTAGVALMVFGAVWLRKIVRIEF